MSDHENARHLEKFLLHHFTSEELRLLARGLPSADALLVALPETASREKMSADLADLLGRRHEINGALLAALLTARPALRAEMDALAAALQIPAPRRVWTGLPDARRYAERRDPPLEQLAVALRPATPGHWEASYRSPPGAPRPLATAILSADRLDALLAPLGLAGLRAGLADPLRRATWPDDAPRRIGAALGAWLLGDEAFCETVFRPLFRHAAPSRPGPSAQPARLRLDLPPELQGLPWPWLVVREQPLVTCGWTVELGPADELGRHHSLPGGFRVLVVDPSTAPDALHISVRTLLDNRWRADKVLRRLRLATTLPRLRQELDDHRPQVLIWAGGCRASDHGPLSLLGGKAGPLEAVLQEAPELKLLLLDRPAPDGSLDALLRRAPAVICPGAADATARRHQALLAGLDALIYGRDPVAAARAVRGGLSESLLTVYCHAAGVQTGRTLCGDDEDTVRKHLDRRDAKAVTSASVGDLVRRPDHRVLVLVGRGDQDQATEDLSEKLHARLDEELAHRKDLIVQPLHVALPAQVSDEGLSAALLAALDGAAPTLEGALTAWLTRHHGRAETTVVLWLDWGAVGSDTDRALSKAEVERWSAYASTALAPALARLPAHLHLVHYLAFALRADADPADPTCKARFDKISRWVTHPSDAARHAAVNTVVLQPLGRVEDLDLLGWLTAPHLGACPHDQAPSVANAVLAQTGGHFNETVALLTAALQTGYHALYAAAPPPPAPDDEGSV